MRILLLLVSVFLASPATADWPRFRGPTGDGVSGDKNLPFTWGPKDNLLWKLELPGAGSSSPIIWGNKVFLTCYTGYGLKKGEGDVKNLQRHLLCIHRDKGEILWKKDIPAKLPETEYSGFILEHGYASSTPVTDGQSVFVFCGRTGVLAFDLNGKQLWQEEVGRYLNNWGSGSSPILHKNLVIVNAAVEKGSLTALDKTTGKEVWRAKGIGDCWATPTLVDLPGGKTEVVLNTVGELLGFDADTGEKLWQCSGFGTATASSTPVARDGIVYAMGAGFGAAPLVQAVKAGGRGDVSKTHILWQQKGGASHTSLLLAGPRLYWISGSIGCLNAKTGDVVFKERLYDGTSEYVSPILVDGTIIAFTKNSGAFVLKAGDKLEQLAHNDLKDPGIFHASPAVSDGKLLIRTNRFLYCIGKK